jgi:excisionase family DNA binding protein
MGNDHLAGNGSSSGRPHTRLLADLTQDQGRPLTTREVAYLTGMSPTFIREEIRAGELQAAVVGRGRKRVFRIPHREAQRYLRRLGLL